MPYPPPKNKTTLIMLIKNLIFYPQITFFINIVVFCSFSRSDFPTSESGCRSGRRNSRGLPVSHHLYVPCAGVPGCRPCHTHIRYGFRSRVGSPLTFLPVYGHTLPASPHSRPSRLRGFHASHTHKTPAFRWRPSGFPDCRPKITQLFSQLSHCKLIIVPHDFP